MTLAKKSEKKNLYVVRPKKDGISYLTLAENERKAALKVMTAISEHTGAATEVGDKIFAPLKARRENFENSHDFAQALRLVEEDHLQILLRETERVIIARWPQIQAVASALLQRQRLEALEIYKIIAALRP